MRSLGPPSEIRRLAEPLGKVLDWTWQRMHWWIGIMVVLYAISGISVIKPGEVAIVLRWGRLVGAIPALRQHGPGLLFALPRPIDEVVRIQVKHVSEVPVTTLARGNGTQQDGEASMTTIDPVQEGYALTGDQNIVQATMVARYRVRDPAEWAFYGPKSEDILRVEVSSAMVRSLGEMGVDRVLSDGREQLVALVSQRTQAGLDAAHSGLELSSLELVDLAPPRALKGDFDAVQSAFIEAQTQQSEARSTAEAIIPEAQTAADQAVQTARGDADAAMATARGDADAFHALEAGYRSNPGVVRERLYFDAVERALKSAGSVRWIPPPTSGSYRGFRIAIKEGGTAGLVQPGGEAEEQ